MARLASLNLATAAPSAPTDTEGGLTGIDKRPTSEAVLVRDPGPKGTGSGGLVGDAVCDLRHHGGPYQAVYAYAGEDLRHWEELLGRPLRPGMFGENLTTEGLEVTGARIGERWKVGADCVLQVSGPRIPCRTFAGFLGERGWVRRFTAEGAPGAYLSVVVPGYVRAGDEIEVVERPDHEVSVGLAFAALTTRGELLARLLEAGDRLPADLRQDVERHVAREERRAAEGVGTRR